MAFAVPQQRLKYKYRSGKSSFKEAKGLPVTRVTPKKPVSYSTVGGRNRYFNDRGKINTPITKKAVIMPKGDIKMTSDDTVRLIPKNRPRMIPRESSIVTTPRSFNMNSSIDKIPAASGKGSHYHTVEHSKKSIINQDGGLPDRFNHLTMIKTGRKISKALKLLGTLQGTTRRLTFNTKQNLKTNITQRGILDHRTGFNQVYNWFMPATTYFSNIDVTFDSRIRAGFPNNSSAGMGVSSSLGLTSAQRTTSIVQYLCVTKHITELEFYNQNMHFPITFKLSLVKCKEYDLGDIYNEIGSKVVPVGTTIPKIDGIPVVYFQNTVNFENWSATNGITFCTNDRAKGMSRSNYFNSNFEVVKTYTRKVEPASTWTVKHEHTMGSGINLNDVTAHARDGADLNYPITYMYFLEAKGVKTEGLYIGGTLTAPTAAESYIGYSPIKFLTEYKTTIEFVNSDTVIPTDGSAQSEVVKVPHIRTFVQDEAANTSLNATDTDNLIVEAFGSANNLAETPATHTFGTWLVPVSTDNVTQYIS